MHFRSLLTFFLTVGFLTFSYAQNRVAQHPEKTYQYKKNNARENDIVSYPSVGDDCSRTVIPYGITDRWGYLSGTNEYLDLIKAQRLEFTGSAEFSVIGAAAYFDSVSVVGDSSVTAKVYGVMPDGSPSALIGTSVPVSASALVPPSDTSVEFTLFGFPNPPFLTESQFFVGIDFSNLYSGMDTAGLFSTMAGCGDGSNTYELWSDGVTWYSYTDTNSWVLNLDLLIEAVVQFGDSMTTSANDYIRHRGLEIYPATPNPANQFTVLNFGLDNDDEVKISIFDSQGKRLRDLNVGRKNAGRNQEEILTYDLSPGTYFYRIGTGNGSLISTFIVQQ